MDFDIGMAVLGGLAGTAAMTVVMYMGYMMRMKMDMPMTLGTMFLPKGGAAWVVGLMIHLMMGTIFFIIYATLFSALGVQSAIPGWSALFGVVHAAIAGTAFGMMPMLHPRMATGSATSSETVPMPGFFGTKMGMMGPMSIVMVHVVYGLVGGVIYAA